ncbi:hypothetical protein NIIDMKKI_20290 [Mycobacterium kansasii]|uniref:MaoC-like domain-containing protein n=1 Tax=Mycobacterium kansasii TaxID=1768 RepID=A0A7G1I941_MYCKA|nr:hypothetical protein NIIDMKKI_20290 [Mycobacterium kansasii]
MWFEEFEIGTTYLHRPGRTVTEADNVLFTTLTMNTQSLHLDAAWAAEQPGFRGERLVNSMFTLSTMVGLSVSQLTLGTIVANLGFSEVSFPAGLSRRHPVRRDGVHRQAGVEKPSRRRHCHPGAHRT